MNKLIILKGEGINQHTLYGTFDYKISETHSDIYDIKIKKDTQLKHEKPNGDFSQEHNALKVDKGNWVTGIQIQYNPFDKKNIKVID